jgi:hypothetical protein
MNCLLDSSSSQKRVLTKRRQCVYQHGSSPSEQEDLIILSQHKDDNQARSSCQKPVSEMDSHIGASFTVPQMTNEFKATDQLCVSSEGIKHIFLILLKAFSKLIEYPVLLCSEQ